MDHPQCLICRDTSAERAHAVPKSLDGSYNIRNFALLCEKHHKESPDVADAEAFWAWIDYACIRQSHTWRTERDQDVFRDGNPAKNHASFMDAVKGELTAIYNWNENDFSEISWEVLEQMHRVLETATGSHFGVAKKASTYAWAYDVARKRVRKQRETKS